MKRDTKSTRVLVAGGAGLIGSHLCEQLIRAGHEVFCLDDFSTGDGAHIGHLDNDPRFTVVHADVTEPIDIDIDEIYNLACPASPKHYQSDPVQTVKTSVYGSINLLELARRNGAKILLASTSEIYGDPKIHPQTESYWGNVNPIGPRACYDEGKRCAETLFFNYRQQYQVRAKVARIFNTYGPRMRAGDGRVVPNFIVQALQGDPITIYGAGTQTRSFCYVDDLIDGLMRLMAAPDRVAGPINLGNPVELSIVELAELVIEMTGSPTQLVFMPLPDDDPCRRRPDVTRARTTLGWEPATPLRQGLARTIEYFEEQRRNGDRLAAGGGQREVA